MLDAPRCGIDPQGSERQRCRGCHTAIRDLELSVGGARVSIPPLSAAQISHSYLVGLTSPDLCPPFFLSRSWWQTSANLLLAPASRSTRSPTFPCLPRRSSESGPSFDGAPTSPPHLPQFSNTKILVTNLGLVGAIVDRANSSNQMTKKLMSQPNHGSGASRYHPRGRIRCRV